MDATTATDPTSIVVPLTSLRQWGRGEGRINNMTATKTTMTIKIEVLSPDSIPGLLFEAMDRIGTECPNGSIGKADGDSISWESKNQEVSF